MKRAIAAKAVALQHTLVTAAEREFARIDDLVCENWLRNCLSGRGVSTEPARSIAR